MDLPWFRRHHQTPRAESATNSFSLPFSYAQRQPGRTSLPKDAGRATTQPDRLSKPDKLPRLRAAQRFEAQYVDSARNGVPWRAPGEPVRTRR